MTTVKEVYDNILAKFDEISNNDKATDGWEAFSEMWDWVEQQSAQSAQREGDVLLCGYCRDVDNAVLVDPKCPVHGWQSRRYAG